MSTTYSLSALRSMYQQETGDFPIVLLEISHPSLASNIYVSSDATQRLQQLTTDEQVIYGTVHNGTDYVFLPVSITLPEDTEDAPPAAKISIENVSQELVGVVRSMDTAPTITMRTIMHSMLDVVEAEYAGFTLGSVDISETELSGTLTIDTLSNEVFPKHTMTPAHCPGLFA